jgi:2-polyprenyl-3-methyl-5-hydroxy-6-metoxy-1,4-benzoquinol methylase
MSSIPVLRGRGWSGLWSSTLAVIFPSLNSREVWEREYARGAWERIQADSEFGRYALIYAHARRQGRQPRVLDVGCGAGRLLSMLGEERGEYVGLDLSTQAIEKARALNAERASFQAGWAEDFQTDQRFDVIVFNEVLYYLRSPERVVEQYKRFLAPGGVIVISMFSVAWSRWIWFKLGRKFRFTHQERVSNQLGHSWDIRVI